MLNDHKVHEVITEEKFLQRDEYINEARSRLKLLRGRLETKSLSYDMHMKALRGSIEGLSKDIASLE